MKSFFKIFTILTKKQKRYCIFLTFAMVIGGALEAIGIGAILPLISIMGQPDWLDRHPNVAQMAASFGIMTYTQLIVLCSLGLIILYFFKNVYLAWQARMQVGFAMKNQILYASELFKSYLAKPYIFHVDHNTAILMRNVSGGAATVFSNILISTLLLLTEMVTGSVIWIMLVAVDSFTAIVVAGFLACILYALIKAFRKKIAEQGMIQNKYSGETGRWINQGLGAIKETKVLRKEAYFAREYLLAYTRYGEANRGFNVLNQLPRLFIETIVVASLLFLIVFKLLQGYSPMDIVPLLGVLALAAFRMMPCANRIVNLSNAIKFQMPLFNELYDEFCEIRDRLESGKSQELLSEAVEKISFAKEIRVEHLAFQYPGGQHEVLKDVSFAVPKGSFVGVVGPSGAGKTTFVDILLGLLSPTGGKITVDGVDIQTNIRGWQANLSYVPQSIYLIDGTIKENVALGVAPEDFDEELLIHVLKMAELYDFVEELPKGVDTMVGERGVKLSGGQRQRIGIARALYQEPQVLILDEATSALDNDTEKNITETLLKLKGTITILSIAHRVSTLQECDFKITFLNGGIFVTNK
ncbi:MAG: ABC transporter ATP-binding protein [Schwartzia succinivorans]|uniref:ABC transporter ATP-binding protein n=1 Tax=Schwartzia succinivorans TaxID=55507 RepID=UPI00235304E2|nr:ABC transporter ATP-binding protein [Schwartzia succinivorans]MBE6097683.1 ABC transporter ATP-binding protein [Schwartzia succinivorans]